MSSKILVLNRGDHLVESLIEYCGKNDIKSAWVSGIGAVSQVTLALYDLDKKQYSKKSFSGSYEIASLSGNVGLCERKLISHLHLLISDATMQAFGGHLEEAVIAATCELHIHILPHQIHRQHDPQIGLNLIVS